MSDSRKAKYVQYATVVVPEFDLTDEKYKDKCIGCGSKMEFGGDDEGENFSTIISCESCGLWVSEKPAHAKFQGLSDDEIDTAVWKRTWSFFLAKAKATDRIPSWLEQEFIAAGSKK